MNKFSRRIIISQLTLIAALCWIAETVIHVVLFSKDTFLDSLILNVSIHEAYTRFLVIAAFSMLYLVIVKSQVIREKEAQIENILNNVIPVCITNKQFEIVMANDSYWAIWGKPEHEAVKCYEHRPGETCHTNDCALIQVLNGAMEYVGESKKEYNAQTHHFIVTARPFYDSTQKIAGIIESFQDITEIRRLETEKVHLIKQLRSSLEKVKQLKGFIPICASCKKIRDDKGYWNQIESYIRKHSEAEFSHGICPDCVKKLYPDIAEHVFQKKEVDTSGNST